MTAKMTDEQITKSFGAFCFENITQEELLGFHIAENVYYPQIQQLQSVNESLHATLEKYVKEHAIMQGEIEQLTAKHEKLVKATKELIDEVNMNFKDDESGRYYEEDMRHYPLPISTIDKIIKLCTESEDK